MTKTNPANERIKRVRKNGYSPETVDRFLECEKQVRAMVRFLDDDRMTDAMRKLRDDAIAEHESGKTAEFV